MKPLKRVDAQKAKSVSYTLTHLWQPTIVYHFTLKNMARIKLMSKQDLIHAHIFRYDYCKALLQDSLRKTFSDRSNLSRMLLIELK